MPTFEIFVDYAAKTSVVVTAKDGEAAQALAEGKLVEALGYAVDSILITHIEVVDNE